MEKALVHITERIQREETRPSRWLCPRYPRRRLPRGPGATADETGRDDTSSDDPPEGDDSSEGDDDIDEPDDGDSATDEGQEPDPDEVEIDEFDPTDTDLTFDYYELEWDLEVPDDATPSLSKRIGSSDDHHDAVVLSESSRADVSLVVRNAADEVLIETDVDLALDSYALLRFEVPDSYTIELEAASFAEVVEVDEQFVDCNASLHSILLREETVECEWASTFEAC